MGWVEASGWIGGPREGGRSVEGGRREGDHQSLRPPPPSPSPHPPSPPPPPPRPPLSPLPLALFPLRLLSARLYPVCLSLSLSFSIPLPIPFPSFRPLSPSYTLRFPRQPAVHPLSFLRSPFLLPFAIPLAALPSLSASFALALLVFRPLSPCPLSPSVCLASSFPSFIPSRTLPFPSSFHSPTSFLFPFRFRRASFSPSILRSPSRFSSISVALSLFFTLFLRSTLPPISSSPFAAISNSLFFFPFYLPVSLRELALGLSIPFPSLPENSSKNIHSDGLQYVDGRRRCRRKKGDSEAAQKIRNNCDIKSRLR